MLDLRYKKYCYSNIGTIYAKETMATYNMIHACAITTLNLGLQAPLGHSQ